MLAEPTTTRTTPRPFTVAPIIQAVYAKRLSDGKLFKVDLEHKHYNRFLLHPISFNQWSFETAPAWQLTSPRYFKLFPIFGA